MNNIPKRANRGGFTALIAVILLATGTIAFSIATVSAAISYADSVNQREVRMQARLNAHSCLDAITLMLAKDFFLNGETAIPELGCIAEVSNPNASSPQSSWTVSIIAVAELNGVKAWGKRTVNMSDFSVVVGSEEI